MMKLCNSVRCIFSGSVIKGTQMDPYSLYVFIVPLVLSYINKISTFAEQKKTRAFHEKIEITGGRGYTYERLSINRPSIRILINNNLSTRINPSITFNSQH